MNGDLYSEGRFREEAFRELIKLCSHYARLLNQYDGGHRQTFETPDEWVARLKSLRRPKEET